MAEQRSFRKNEIIYRTQEPEGALFIVQEGSVKVSIGDRHDKEVILYIVQKGDFFGESSVLDDGYYSGTASALEPCHAIVLARRPLREFVGKNPAVLMEMVSALSQRLRRIELKVSRLVFADAYEKVASVLVDALKEKRVPLNVGAEVPLCLPRKELAGLVGVSRETFTRVIAAFQKAGLVRLRQRRIAVINPGKLKREAARSGLT
jgi:CRP/FNR family transcriptional regulator